MKMNETTSRYSDNIGKIKKAMNLVNLDFIPVLLQLDAMYYSGLQNKAFITSSWNPDLLLECYKKGAEYFQHDCCLGIDYISPKLHSILRSRSWIQDKENGYMQHLDVSPMKENDYPYFIADPVKCIMEKILPRIYKNLENPLQINTALLKAAIHYYTEINGFYSGMYESSLETEIPICFGTTKYAPFDLLADHLRGISGISFDLALCPEYIEQSCEILEKLMLKYIKNTFPVPSEGFPFVCVWVHLPPLISTAHFERFFWPTFKSLSDTLVSLGYNLYFQFQGDYNDGRYFEYLRDLPSGRCILSFDHCDLELVKNELGSDHCITANFPLEFLRTESLETCIEEAKRLINIGNKGNSFIFNFDKSPLCLNDADPEKLKSLISFVQNYAV